jgi:hypothetical protein
MTCSISLSIGDRDLTRSGLREKKTIPYEIWMFQEEEKKDFT